MTCIPRDLDFFTKNLTFRWSFNQYLIYYLLLKKHFVHVGFDMRSM